MVVKFCTFVWHKRLVSGELVEYDDGSAVCRTLDHHGVASEVRVRDPGGRPSRFVGELSVTEVG